MLLVQGEDKLHHRRTAFRVHEGHSSGLYLQQMGQVQSLPGGMHGESYLNAIEEH